MQPRHRARPHPLCRQLKVIAQYVIPARLTGLPQNTGRDRRRADHQPHHRRHPRPQQAGLSNLAGPPLVKAAIGEVVTAEELGGAEVHTGRSGVADHLAENDEHALAIARNIIATLPAPAGKMQCDEPREPVLDPGELGGVIPAN